MKFSERLRDLGLKILARKGFKAPLARVRRI